MVGCVVHIVGGDISTVEVVAQHERQLNFDLRVDVIGPFERPAVRNKHVVKQDAVVRLVDLHRLLHRSAGKTDLLAANYRARLDL